MYIESDRGKKVIEAHLNELLNIFRLEHFNQPRSQEVEPSSPFSTDSVTFQKIQNNL